MENIPELERELLKIIISHFPFSRKEVEDVFIKSYYSFDKTIATLKTVQEIASSTYSISYK